MANMDEDSAAAVRSDAGGLAVLFDRHRAELHRFLVARCGSAADAEDHMQDLWLKLQALRPGPIANGRAYLFRVANNLVLDKSRSALREAARQGRWVAEEHGAGEVQDRVDPACLADESLAHAEELALLHRAVNALPQGAQRALKLYRFDGLNQTEVAGQMGISRSAVEKHLAVAMKHLRRAFIGWGDAGAVTSQSSEGADRTSNGGEP